MSSERAWIGAAVKATLACAGAVIALGWMAASADARVIYVVQGHGDHVVPFDTALGTAGEPIPVGGAPIGIALTPDGQAAYTANYLDGTVIPVDLVTKTAGEPIEVGLNPFGVAISPDGESVFVTNSFSNTVSVIATKSNEVVKTIPVGSNPRHVAIAPDGMTAYVASYDDDTVTPIDTQSGTTEQAIEVGSGPLAIAITPDGKTAYVANSLDNTVTPIDTATKTAEEPIAVGGSPWVVAVTPDGGTAYVANFLSFSVSAIDTTAGTVVKTIPVQQYPNAITLAPGGSVAYVWSGYYGLFIPIDTATNEAGGMIEPGWFGDLHWATTAMTPNQPPSAALSAPATTYAGVPVSFDASASADELGIESYRFDFGDGSFATSANPTRNHVYTEPGTYEAAVTVDDGEGCEPLPEFFPDLASPFTGQTAYCNGPSRVTSETVEIQVEELPPLELAASLKRPQSSLRSVRVTATCANIDCEANAIGRLRVKPAGGKGRVFKLSTDKRSLTADASTALAPKIPATARRAARKALATGGKVRAKLRVIAKAPGDQRQVRLRQVRIVGSWEG